MLGGYQHALCSFKNLASVPIFTQRALSIIIMQMMECKNPSSKLGYFMGLLLKLNVFLNNLIDRNGSQEGTEPQTLKEAKNNLFLRQCDMSTPARVQGLFLVDQ